MKVNLTYFKQSGKYYTSGTYETNQEHMFEIFAEIRLMLQQGNCPGLSGCSDFNVLVECTEHNQNHPALITYPYDGRINEIPINA